MVGSYRWLACLITDLVANVTSSVISDDHARKLHTAGRNGFREYVASRVLDREVDWFVNSTGKFEPWARALDAILRSTALAGLGPDAAALVRGDWAAAFAALQLGLQSPEHTEFVARLERARTA